MRPRTDCRLSAQIQGVDRCALTSRSGREAAEATRASGGFSLHGTFDRAERNHSETAQELNRVRFIPSSAAHSKRRFAGRLQCRNIQSCSWCSPSYASALWRRLPETHDGSAGASPPMPQRRKAIGAESTRLLSDQNCPIPDAPHVTDLFSSPTSRSRSARCSAWI